MIGFVFLRGTFVKDRAGLSSVMTWKSTRSADLKPDGSSAIESQFDTAMTPSLHSAK